jgi:four helix bundle protein
VPNQSSFVVYDFAVEMARKCHAVVYALRRNDVELADQLRRASISAVLNGAKGRGRWGKDARRHALQACKLPSADALTAKLADAEAEAETCRC